MALKKGLYVTERQDVLENFSFFLKKKLRGIKNYV